MPFDLAEEFIRAAEAKLGRRLPESYRLAMKERNGGTVFAVDTDWQLHPILDTSDRKRLSRTSNDVIRETGNMQDWRGWPENALAIAADGSGDSLAFLQSDDVFDPAVYVWSHETGEITLVVEDFSELERGD